LRSIMRSLPNPMPIFLLWVLFFSSDLFDLLIYCFSSVESEEKVVALQEILEVWANSICRSACRRKGKFRNQIILVFELISI
jgi:hypothetical protein